MTDVAAHPQDATTGIATATGLGGESLGMGGEVPR